MHIHPIPVDCRKRLLKKLFRDNENLYDVNVIPVENETQAIRVGVDVDMSHIVELVSVASC